MSAQSPVLLIDASIYIFQYYFSLPDNWFNEEESWPTAAVYGYTAFLVRLLEAQQPSQVAACFDESLDSCFRNTIYPDYKSSRALPDEALAFQLNACKAVTELMGIRSFASQTHEADDLLGSLYQLFLDSPQSIAILTRDKDLGQLLARPQDYLWDYAKDHQFYSGDIQNKFGVPPHCMADYLALVGDVSDDIPGVPGVGPKTASNLLNHFGGIDALLLDVESIADLSIRGAKSLGQKIALYHDQIVMAKQLATIVKDLPIVKDVSQLSWQTPDWDELSAFCEAMGFPRLYSRIQSLQAKF